VTSGHRNGKDRAIFDRSILSSLALVMVVIVIVVVVIPVVLGFPAVLSRVPPLMVGPPTALAFGIQVAPPLLGFMAALAMPLDCVVQSRFRLFDRMLAPRSVIGMHSRRSQKQKKR
jgi:hypothetical protein